MPQGRCEHAGAGKHKLNLGARTQNSTLRVSLQTPLTWHNHPPMLLCVTVHTLQAACLMSPGPSREMDPWDFHFSALEHLSGSHTQNSAGKLPGTTNRPGQQG